VGVHDVSGADGIVGHDLRLILKRVADVAVLIAQRADRSVVQFILVAKIGIPLVVVRLPGNVVFQQDVSDACAGWWGGIVNGVL